MQFSDTRVSSGSTPWETVTRLMSFQRPPGVAGSSIWRNRSMPDLCYWDWDET